MKGDKSAQVQEVASFESALKQLELIVQKMEQEDLPIEEALGHFEAGIKLSAYCQQVLKTAEQKIEVVQNSISTSNSNFNSNSNSNSGVARSSGGNS